MCMRDKLKIVGVSTFEIWPQKSNEIVSLLHVYFLLSYQLCSTIWRNADAINCVENLLFQGSTNTNNNEITSKCFK
jgi:hypothetical protein